MAYAQVSPAGAVSFSLKLDFQIPRIWSEILLPILEFSVMNRTSAATPIRNQLGDRAYSSIQKFANSVGMNEPANRMASDGS